MIEPRKDEQLAGPPWGVADFVLVMLTGFAGALVAALLVLSIELEVAATVVIAALGMSLGHAAGLYAVLTRRSASLADLGFEVTSRDGAYVLLGAALQILMAIAMAPLAELADSDGTTQVVADQIATADGLAIQIALVLLIGLVAPIMEELAFRGILLQAAQRRSRPWIAVTVTAVVFSLFHWLGVDQSNVLAGLLTLIQLLIVGLVLGALTVRQGRLGPAILTHAGFNMVTLLLLFGTASLPT